MASHQRVELQSSIERVVCRVMRTWNRLAEMNQKYAQTVNAGRSSETVRLSTFAENNQAEKGLELGYHNTNWNLDKENVGKIRGDTNMEGSGIGQARTKRGTQEGIGQSQVAIEDQVLNEEVQILEKPHQTQARKGGESKNRRLGRDQQDRKTNQEKRTRGQGGEELTESIIFEIGQGRKPTAREKPMHPGRGRGRKCERQAQSLEPLADQRRG